MDDFRPLKADEAAALLAFAEAHGRTWKAVLLDGWARAAFPGVLQRLRNCRFQS